MKLETRRVFISDLPENVKESDLCEKFGEYGQVASVEIKQRKEIGPKNQSLFFAFISLEVDSSNLQRCFADFANKKWKGQFIELQMAKESFLARLNKEREEVKSTAAIETKIENSHIEHNGLSNNVSSSDYIFQKGEGKTLKRAADENTHVPEIIFKSNARHNTVGGKLKIESVGNDPIIKIEKPKPKSKDPKRAEADSKRIKSMIEMKKGYQQQKLQIKNALAKIDSKPVNKIVFGDEQNLDELGTTRSKKAKLFDDDEDENENKDYNFEIKEQFQGKKGQKLLELQSRYKQDERFALSSKFLDDNNEEDAEDIQPKNKSNEKEEQLMILEKVLGHKIKIKENTAEDDRKNRKTMLRFDPTHPDHAKYEVKTEEVTSTTKKKKRKAIEVTEKEEEAKPIVSKEKFYEVAGDLKEALNVKESFSLLQAFGKVASQEKDATDSVGDDEQKVRVKNHFKSGEKNPFKYDSSDDESDADNSKQFEANEEKLERTNKDVKKHLNLGPGRLWTEPFFFRNDDSRLQEGVDFMKKLQAEEVTEFSKVRRDLVEIVKAKVKNNQRRNRPFKKKLGGRKMLKIKRAMKR